MIAVRMMDGMVQAIRGGLDGGVHELILSYAAKFAVPTMVPAMRREPPAFGDRHLPVDAANGETCGVDLAEGATWC